MGAEPLQYVLYALLPLHLMRWSENGVFVLFCMMVVHAGVYLVQMGSLTSLGLAYWLWQPLTALGSALLGAALWWIWGPLSRRFSVRLWVHEVSNDPEDPLEDADTALRGARPYSLAAIRGGGGGPRPGPRRAGRAVAGADPEPWLAAEQAEPPHWPLMLDLRDRAPPAGLLAKLRSGRAHLEVEPVHSLSYYRQRSPLSVTNGNETTWLVFVAFTALLCIGFIVYEEQPASRGKLAGLIVCTVLQALLPASAMAVTRSLSPGSMTRGARASWQAASWSATGVAVSALFALDRTRLPHVAVAGIALGGGLTTLLLCFAAARAVAHRLLAMRNAFAWGRRVGRTPLMANGLRVRASRRDAGAASVADVVGSDWAAGAMLSAASGMPYGESLASAQKSPEMGPIVILRDSFTVDPSLYA